MGMGSGLEWKSSNLDFSLALLHGPRLWLLLSDLKDPLMSSAVCVFWLPLGQTQSLGCLKRAGPQRRSGQRRVSSLEPDTALWPVAGAG